MVGMTNCRAIQFLNPLPFPVAVGDDIWIPDPVFVNHKVSTDQTAHPYSVHQIESINSSREFVTIDWPIGLTVRAGNHWHLEDLLITDRRIPFQSRSATWGNVMYLYHSVPGDQPALGSLWTIELGMPHNASVGDFIWFTISGAKIHTVGYEVTAVQIIPSLDSPMTTEHSRMYLKLDSVLPTQLTSGTYTRSHSIGSY